MLDKVRVFLSNSYNRGKLHIETFDHLEIF